MDRTDDIAAMVADRASSVTPKIALAFVDAIEDAADLRRSARNVRAMTPWPGRTIKPPALRRGDRVAVVTPSWGGPGAQPERYARGRRVLEELFGVQVVEMPHALDDLESVSRNPRARADDLNAAFRDPSVRAVIASIGGEDSVRVLPFLDLDAIAANPKIYLGYSDSTSIHFGIRKAGVTSFYGPTVMAGFAENVEPFAYMVDAVRRTLFETAPVGIVEPNRAGWTDEHLEWGDPSLRDRRRALKPSTGPRTLQGRGTVRGPLIGGCAEVLEMLKGTPWWPPVELWRRCDLLLRDVGRSAQTGHRAALAAQPRVAGHLARAQRHHRRPAVRRRS